VCFIILGLRKRVHIFETFVEGAKEGFNTSIRIIPFLIGILVAIGVFRTSGTLKYIEEGIGMAVGAAGLDTDFVPAIPVALLKPLTGQGARSMMIEVTKAHGGPDAFVGQVASIMRGCAETTLYLLALYFGSVSVRNTRYAVTGGLIADFTGAIAGIIIAYIFFH